MQRSEIIQISHKCLGMLETNSSAEALEILKPVLSRKVPFPLLDHAGIILGNATDIKQRDLIQFLDKIEGTKAMGGYVIIASALSCFISSNLPKAMEKAKEYIIKGDIWYVADITGERVSGKALVERFHEAIPLVEIYLNNSNPWVKRSAGVAVHYFAKRVRDDKEKAKKLIGLLSPYIEEKDTRIVKGIGWGFKTLGRYYPELVVDFFEQEHDRKPSELFRKKALTYLPPELKAKII